MHSIFSFLSRYGCSKRQQKRIKGFTLIELLVSLIVSGLVITTLLYVVVELVKIDKREATLDQVQNDMKRAMDYITEDLQEAVYVYGDPQRIYDQLSDDPQFPESATPVLAFWRIDPLDDLPECTGGTEEFINLCEVLRIRQAAYTLVVYSQQANDENTNWPGQSRIIRYELSRYNDAGLPTLTERDGYRDPTDSTDDDASFENWLADGTPAGNSAVLVDFVQNPSAPFARAPLAANADESCEVYGSDEGTPLYTVSPATASTTTNTSFFACVRNPDPDNNPLTTDRANQDVFVFLRGSTQGLSGGVTFFSEESSLPILETQVLVKGIIDKNL